MTSNILSYFTNRSPLYNQITQEYNIEIRYKEETRFILYTTEEFIYKIYNYEKNIKKNTDEIRTPSITRVYSFNYKALYYNNDNYIKSHSRTFVNYWFNNKNKYLIKTSIDYRYNRAFLYRKDIFFLYNFKYIKKCKHYNYTKYKKQLILIPNKYELLYFSNILLIFC